MRNSTICNECDGAGYLSYQADNSCPTCKGTGFVDKDPYLCESCGVPLTDHIGLYGTCKQLQEAIERIKELEAKTTWQPIATAPKNGELVLIWDNCRNSCVIAYHCDCGWLEGFHEYRIFHPTHWIPLPSTPKEEV